MRLTADDAFVRRLADDMGSLISGTGGLRDSVRDRLIELAERQSDTVARHFQRKGRGFGVPTSANRGAGLFHFPEVEPVRVFRTSGTSGRTRGVAAYSPRGFELLNLTILRQARQKLALGVQGRCFASIRLLPASAVVPEVVMAYGMETIAQDLGFPTLSDTAFIGSQLDFPRLKHLLQGARAEGAPVLLTGGTFTLVNACDTLLASGEGFELPKGSVVLDAGGLKNRARSVSVTEYTRLIERCFGPVRCVNLFGMTELTSQLYDVDSKPVGPRGERVKGGCPWVFPTVRDPVTLSAIQSGMGLLEIADLATLDRPCVILSDDIAVATSGGAAVIGRAMGAPTRGCALHIEELSGSGA